MHDKNTFDQLSHMLEQNRRNVAFARLSFEGFRPYVVLDQQSYSGCILPLNFHRRQC